VAARTYSGGAMDTEPTVGIDFLAAARTSNYSGHDTTLSYQLLYTEIRNIRFFSLYILNKNETRSLMVYNHASESSYRINYNDFIMSSISF
jgi:hypothetical protein